MDNPSDIAVRVVLAFAEQQHQMHLTLSTGTTAREAVLIAAERGLDMSAVGSAAEVTLGVFGEQVGDEYLLLNDDRVEIYRPLLQSPMELRRQRAAAQKSDASSRKNPGV